MIGSNYTYNGYQIDVSHAEYDIYLDDNVNPLEINSSEKTEQVIGYHGENASPTYARNRVIGISGVIVSDTRLGFGKAMAYLNSLFRLQGNTGTLQLKPFQFTDDEGIDWKAEVKVKTPIKYKLEENDGTHFIRRFVVVLSAPDPKLLSPDETSQSGEEGSVGGLAITNEGIAITEEGLAINEIGGEFIIAPAAGNQPLEPRFEITVLKPVNEYLRIKNGNTGEYIQFNIEAEPGQVFIIDSSNETATLDGVNIMATKTGGNFITIDGETPIEIYDADQRYYGNDMAIIAYFRNILI